jgi:sporulation protein YunB
MNRKSRNRRRWLLALLIAFLLFFALTLRFRYAPYVKEAAKTKVVNAVSAEINKAVNAQLASGSVNYSDMAVLEKDASGRITAVRTNMEQANRLKAETMSLLGKTIMDIDTSKLSVPLGNVLLPELFTGEGPGIPVKIVSLSTSDAEFSTRFTAAGINQTLQQTTLTVSVSLTLLTPVGTVPAQVSSNIVVAETAIVGSVPNTYLQLDKG